MVFIALLFSANFAKIAVKCKQTAEKKMCLIFVVHMDVVTDSNMNFEDLRR